MNDALDAVPLLATGGLDATSPAVATEVTQRAVYSVAQPAVAMEYHVAHARGGGPAVV